MSERWQVEPEPGLLLLELYDEALPAVFGYLLSRSGSRTLAEDLTAETFVAAMGSLRARTTSQPTVAWLIGIARHKLVDHWRRAERDERAIRVLSGGLVGPEDPWESEIDAIRARGVLMRLGAPHRAALTLRYLDGLSVPEVAAHLDRTIHATEALLVRARAAFRRSYEREEGESGG
ncbi:RNA polymerase sigma24 factor [Microlunatus endophyticus]|uniref:RNA polymerase sigma24 factor n=1 Tax=Microlunatus endophyticus TaxID=1716077 RepID=A0A917S3H4_9ACTN|nr:sigma-70 family RNA polymerase sigma factor [Microlunatus endophyticus]GGL50737.1 RNA polymerase sigma24 factor [Microlunatus endophyticus]